MATSNTRKWKPPSKQEFYNIVAPLLAEKPRDLHEMVREIEERWGSVFNLSAVSYEARIDQLKCDIVRERLRSMDARIEGQRIRTIASASIQEPLGLVGPDGKPAYRTRHLWVSLAHLLIHAASGDEALKELRQAVEVIVQGKDAMRRGLTVDIDGVQYMVKRVGEGLVFQPSMFGLEEQSA